MSKLKMGADGVEPPEPKGSRFTVCPATSYGINSLNLSAGSGT